MESDSTQSSLLRRLHDPKDNESWGEFYEVYQPLLLRYVRSRDVDAHDAEDMVQDIFMNKLRSAMTQFDLDHQRGRFRTWLFQVTSNAVIDWQRRKQHQPEAVGQSGELTGAVSPSVTEELSREWEHIYREQIMAYAVKRCRDTIEPRTWACFEQRTMRGRSGAEVADELGLSVSAVYTNAHRVLEKVREICAGHGEELSAVVRDAK